MRRLPLSAVKAGMVLARPIYGPDGQLWLNAGVILKETYLESLKHTNVTHVYVGDPLLWDVVVDKVVSDETRAMAVKTVKKTLQEMKTGVLQNGRFIDNRFFFTVEKLVQEILHNRDVIYNLDDIRTADDYTFCHSVNVCILALMIANELRMPRRQLEELAVGALLHDVGKIYVNQAILKKEGSLSPEEYEEIKKHPVYGYDILSQQKNIAFDSIKVVAQHHERCDGSGYPLQLCGEDIHDYAKLVMIADVFDALTANRPYRKAMRPDEAIEIITGSTHLYDMDMIRAFIFRVAAFPVGTAVRLSNDDMGIVIKTHKGMPLRPVVRVCKRGDGTFYPRPYDLDLTEALDLVIKDVLSDEERELEMPISM
ncbi:MAG: HD-GYP domain-containing protein [Firmicutes bacterium]|nr:HD-GYP domain-containing protein [Bacillota bacterium]